MALLRLGSTYLSDVDTVLELLVFNKCKNGYNSGIVKYWALMEGFCLLQTYKWICSYLWKSPRRVGLLLVSIALAACIELYVPSLIRQFVDDLLPNRNVRLFWVLVGVLALLAIVLLGVKMAQTLLQRRVQEEASQALQLDLFRHMRKLGFAYYEQQPAGKTIALLNTEAASVQKMYRQLLPGMVEALFFSAVSMCLMIGYSWKLTLLCVPFFLLYYALAPAVERRAAAASKGLAGARIITNQKAYETVSALQELRANSAERWDLERYMQTVEGWNRSLIRTYFFNYFRFSIRTATNYLGALTLFAAGVYMVRAHQLSIGTFIAFFLYYTGAINQMTRLIQTIADQRIVIHQAERLQSFLSAKPLVTELSVAVALPAPVRGGLVFEQVSFGYSPDRPQLRDIEFRIAPGERVAVVGESGSGKSTLFKLISRFYDPCQGRVLLDDVPIDSLSFESLRGSIGMVLQETYLFGQSIGDNIRFGRPEASDEEVIAAAEAACAHEFIQALPNGYHTAVGERGNQLSGGQKQRIALARALLQQPAVLLLDEATSALDNQTERKVMIGLDKMTQGRTVIAIAHRLSTIQNFDRILVFEQGKLVEAGVYEELIQSGGRFAQLAAREEQNEQLEG